MCKRVYLTAKEAETEMQELRNSETHITSINGMFQRYCSTKADYMLLMVSTEYMAHLKQKWMLLS